MSDSIKIAWNPNLKAHLQKLADRPQQMTQAVASAIYMEGEETISDSKPLVPVLHGFLVNSGFCQLPEIQQDQVQVTFGFGGVAGTGNQGATNDQDVGYAIYVHEDMTAHHSHGQAKFLEVPLTNRLDSMSDRLAGRIEAALP